MASNKELGRIGELAAADYLEGLGYRIVARNVRYRFGELDLVAEEGQVLVFVEVKTRRGERFGSAVEAITPAKQRQLVKLASLYLAAGRHTNRSCRFDIVTVVPNGAGGWQCRLWRNAFSA
jgi:putative endonuclease